jgi:hypothetical protein
VSLSIWHVALGISAFSGILHSPTFLPVSCSQRDTFRSTCLGSNFQVVAGSFGQRRDRKNYAAFPGMGHTPVHPPEVVQNQPAHQLH